MTDFEVEDRVTFAGRQGKITNIEDRPNGGHLLHVYTTDGQLRKLPSGLPHIEKVDSIVDRLEAQQIAELWLTLIIKSESYIPKQRL